MLIQSIYIRFMFDRQLLSSSSQWEANIDQITTHCFDVVMLSQYVIIQSLFKDCTCEGQQLLHFFK